MIEVGNTAQLEDKACKKVNSIEKYVENEKLTLFSTFL